MASSAWSTEQGLPAYTRAKAAHGQGSAQRPLRTLFPGLTATGKGREAPSGSQKGTESKETG